MGNYAKEPKNEDYMNTQNKLKRNDVLLMAAILGITAIITMVASVSIIFTIEADKNVFYFGNFFKDAFQSIYLMM